MMIKYILIFSNLLNCNMEEDREIVEKLRAALKEAKLDTYFQLIKQAIKELSYFEPIFKVLEEKGLKYDMFGLIFGKKPEDFLKIITDNFCGKTLSREEIENLRNFNFQNEEYEKHLIALEDKKNIDTYNFAAYNFDKIFLLKPGCEAKNYSSLQRLFRLNLFVQLLTIQTTYHGKRIEILITNAQDINKYLLF